MTTSTVSGPRTERRADQPLLASALAFTGLTIAGAFLGGSSLRPDSAPADVLAYTAANEGTMTWGAALLVGSAFSLLAFASMLVRRMRDLGVTGAGPRAGLAGATVAAASIVVSALVSWTAAQTAFLGDPAVAKTLATLWFATGGVGFVGPFGMLLLAVAGSALIQRVLPPAIGWAALVVGVLSVSSAFALATDVLFPLLLIGRFGGLLVLLATAIWMRRSGSEGVVR